MDVINITWWLVISHLSCLWFKPSRKCGCQLCRRRWQQATPSLCDCVKLEPKHQWRQLLQGASWWFFWGKAIITRVPGKLGVCQKLKCYQILDFVVLGAYYSGLLVGQFNIMFEYWERWVMEGVFINTVFSFSSYSSCRWTVKMETETQGWCWQFATRSSPLLTSS